MRALAVALALDFAPPVAAACLLGCDTDISEPAAAQAAFESDWGQSLPAGVTVEHIFQGGFQDRFIQVVISTNQAGASVLLPMLGLPADPVTAVDPAQLGPPGPDWWQPQTEVALLGGSGTLPGFAETIVAIAQFPGTYDQVTIYLFAYQT